MNIEIPQPTVLERLKRDLKEAKKRLKDIPEELEASIFFEMGYVNGLKWAIKNLEANK